MSTSLTRRQVAKGAAWAAPVVAATAAVPAYAASANSTPSDELYQLAVPVNATTQYTDDGCDYPERKYSDFTFETHSFTGAYKDGISVFSLPGQDAPVATATVNSLQLRVGWLAGVVGNMTVASGDWTVSGPAQTTVTYENDFGSTSTDTIDYWTFTYTGVNTNQTGTTAGNAPSFPNSNLVTTVTPANSAVCMPRTTKAFSQLSASWDTDKSAPVTTTDAWAATSLT